VLDATLPAAQQFSKQHIFYRLRGVLAYGWIGHKSSSGFSDIPRPALGVFASLDRL
jgi:hypothetical protein